MALQTKDFSVSGTSSSGGIRYTYTLRVTENSVNVVNNTSNVTVEAILQQNYNGQPTFSSWGTGVSCTLNGTQVFSDYRQRALYGTAGTVYHTWTGDVAHNADGTLALKVGGKLWQNSSASFTPPTLTIVENAANVMTLTVIHRQHDISAAAANIEETAMIAINTNGDSLTHSIAYSFGNLTGFIDASGNPVSNEVKFSAASVGFKVPASFYSQITDWHNGVCFLMCKTYSGNTQVGNATEAKFTATAARSKCAPAVSGTVVDSNEATKKLTGDPNRLVRYCSTALCTLKAEAKNGASIKERKIAGRSVSENTLSIPAVETGSFSFWAKDSRGYDDTYTPPVKELIPYIKLTNNAVGVRTDPTSGNARILFSGNYFSGSFGAVDNTLTVAYRPSGSDQWEVVTPAIAEGQYSAEVSLEKLEYTQSYSYEVKVEDKLEAVVKTVTIGQGIPVFDWGKDYFNVNTLLNGLSVISKLQNNKTSFWLQSQWSQWDDGNGRQSMFMFGSDNWRPFYGLLTVRSNGEVQWSGQGGLIFKTSADDSSLLPGVVEVTMPTTMWDVVTIIGHGHISFI